MSRNRGRLGMSMSLKSLLSFAKIVACAMIAAGVSACGFDGVQLNGKIFDAVGLNGPTTHEEVKLKERQQLVVPPHMAALPQPGSGKNATTDIAEIKDHDAELKRSPEELAAAQKAYCDKHYNENAAINDPSLDNVSGPAGPCRKSILSNVQIITGSNNNQASDEE